MTHRSMLLALGGLLLSACATTPDRVATAEADPVAEATSPDLITRSEVVAIVANLDGATDLEQKAARWGYALKRKEALSGLGLWLLTFDCPPGIDPEVASRELVNLRPSSAVEADYKYRLQAAVTPAALVPRVMPSDRPLHYANAMIGWPEDGCEPLVKVGMIDGGVDVDAAGLRSDQVKIQSFVERRAAVEHGTAIAELLVGKGRLRNADLLAAEVVTTDTDGEIYSGVRPMLRALDWMVSENVGVVNISLAGPYNSTLSRGIDRARARGVRVVAAVGNAGADAPPLYPAALKNVVAATAVDSDKKIYDRAVRGRHVDVAAPGVDVFVGGEAGGHYVSGTSIAAPFVTARIAADPDLARESDMRDLLRKLSAATRDLGEAGRDDVYGLGLIEAAACP